MKTRTPVTVLFITALVIVFTFTSPATLTLNADVALAQQSATTDKPAVVHAPKGDTKVATLDAAMRELCLADGMTWKENDVIYIGLKARRGRGVGGAPREHDSGSAHIDFSAHGRRRHGKRHDGSTDTEPILVTRDKRRSASDSHLYLLLWACRPRTRQYPIHNLVDFLFHALRERLLELHLK